MTNRNFPYPLKTDNITVYGRDGCPYCMKMKDIAENVSGSVYYDIDDLIKKGIVKSFNDFKRKMKPFIDEYDMVPIVFTNDIFIGGYDNFIEQISKKSSENEIGKIQKKKNTLLINSNKEIKKEERKLLELLDVLSKKNRLRKTA